MIAGLTKQDNTVCMKEQNTDLSVFLLTQMNGAGYCNNRSANHSPEICVLSGVQSIVLLRST